MMILFGGENN